MAKDPTQGPITRFDAQGKSYIVNAADEPKVETVPAPPPPLPVVILAGGKGTRLQEATKGIMPKPMIEIGGTTLAEHIIDIYANQGFKEFYIASGFMADSIHRWWNFRLEHFKERGLEVLPVPTGIDTETGGRLKRLVEKIAGRPFMMTYGDGLSNLNLLALTKHHMEKQPMVTLTASHPPARFGNIVIADGMAVEFGEKTQVANDWVNSGFYIIEPEIFDYIPNDQCRFEYDVLPVLALQNKLAAYQHPSFFQMIDTPRDLDTVNKMWDRGEVPWLSWMKKA